MSNTQLKSVFWGALQFLEYNQNPKYQSHLVMICTDVFKTIVFCEQQNLQLTKDK
jgi:hypothetical protein